MTDRHKLLDKLSTIESTYFSAYQAQVRRNREMYECEWSGEVNIAGADDYMIFIPPTAARNIDDVADHVLTMPKTRVPTRADNDDPMAAQMRAEKVRKFLAAWWSRVVEDSNPIGDSIVAALNEGRFVWRRTFDMDKLPDKPEEGAPRSKRRAYRKEMADLGKSEFLWHVEVMDNLDVFEDPRSHRDPNYLFLKYEITTEDAKETYPDAGGEWRKGDDFEPVIFTEYWSKPTDDDPGKCIRWIDDDMVEEYDNPYSYIPVIIEDSGFGTNRHGAKPAEKYRGMTEKLFSTFIAEARQMTGWEIANELSIFPMVKAWNMGRGRKITIAPGVITDLNGAKGDPESEDIEYMQMPAIPVGVLQLVQKTTQLANATTKADTISGQPQSGVETATEAGQQINNASAKLSRTIAAYQRACARMNRMTLMDVEHSAEGPITIYGSSGEYGEVRLEPSDIDGFYENTVELRTSDQDMVSQIKARFWGEMYRLIPFLSAFTAMERGEIADDPAMELMRRASEDVFLSPEMTMIRTLTGSNSFGEFATLVKGSGLQAGNTGNQEKAPGMEGGELTPMADMANPAQAQTVDTAIESRDISQKLGQLRAPREVQRAYQGNQG